MDRLTRWNGKKYVLPQGKGVWREIAERLAAYENTGLEPEEVEALKVQQYEAENESPHDEAIKDFLRALGAEEHDGVFYA